jgi:hypothetical protein
MACFVSLKYSYIIPSIFWSFSVIHRNSQIWGTIFFGSFNIPPTIYSVVSTVEDTF